MNLTEILDALDDLSQQPFNRHTFPYNFLRCFDNKETTIKKLQSTAKSSTNMSDIGGVLQRNNIHILTCNRGEVETAINQLRRSPMNEKYRVKTIVATDGADFWGERLTDGEILQCPYTQIADTENYPFFMPLTGTKNIKPIEDSPLDIKATQTLNKLYLRLLHDNPDWDKGKKQTHMNHFMAQLIFCFFAEDTNIFSKDLFSTTVKNFAPHAPHTHTVIGEIFQAMATETAQRQKHRYANAFPYVNGGLFAPDNIFVPTFSKLAKTYLERVGALNWRQINPDIFGSMIQSIADENERSNIGMHYTSVPNIMKVLNPLFLDELHEKYADADDNSRKLKNLKNRIKKIRVFDPACGSGNFLVIAYKELRKLEYQINKKLNTPTAETVIPINNFRGIELRGFSTEIARLALILSEYQCDVKYIGEKLALNHFLPLSNKNWITCGNALRLDWLDLCPPTGKQVNINSDNLFEVITGQAQIDFENEGGETYIIGNPPYLGKSKQTAEQKDDMKWVFEKYTNTYRSLDYVTCWFMKSAEYAQHTPTKTALVTTNSICQGISVAGLWKYIFNLNHKIIFAHTSFKWQNLASHNAGVTVVIIGISNIHTPKKRLFYINDNNQIIERQTDNINAYLIAGADMIIDKEQQSICGLPEMLFGNMPLDGGHLLLNRQEVKDLNLTPEQHKMFIRPIYGAAEFIQGKIRYCLWIHDEQVSKVLEIPTLENRITKTKEFREKSKRENTKMGALTPHKFTEIRQIGNEKIIVVPSITSENREYLPCGILSKNSIITHKNFGLFDAPLWCMALIVSKMHYAWADIACGKMGTGFCYSNTLGWNTFPVPKLTTQNKHDLTKSAENILLIRESHFPKTIANLYNPKTMPPDLRQAHQQNDEIIDRIYAGKKFATNTDRLTHLFTQYKKQTTTPQNKI